MTQSITLTRGLVRHHFLDSGAFTFQTSAREYSRRTGRGPYAYYSTAEFWDFLDRYGEFVKANAEAIDYFANADVIPHPELTWRNQQYLENVHGVRPVPVVHHKTDVKWLEHYLSRDYDFICLGGLVGVPKPEAIPWLDRCFDLICSGKDRLPRVRVHGFGVTSTDLMLRYPWWSVDSTSWFKVGAFGGILVPPPVRGEWCYSEPPEVIKIALDSPSAKLEGKHYSSITAAEKEVVARWLELVEVPMGEGGPPEPAALGVLNHHSYRKAANLRYFQLFASAQPEWPQPFKIKLAKGFFR